MALSISRHEGNEQDDEQPVLARKDSFDLTTMLFRYDGLHAHSGNAVVDEEELEEKLKPRDTVAPTPLEARSTMGALSQSFGSIGGLGSVDGLAGMLPIAEPGPNDTDDTGGWGGTTQVVQSLSSGQSQDLYEPAGKQSGNSQSQLSKRSWNSFVKRSAYQDPQLVMSSEPIIKQEEPAKNTNGSGASPSTLREVRFVSEHLNRTSPGAPLHRSLPRGVPTSVGGPAHMPSPMTLPASSYMDSALPLSTVPRKRKACPSPAATKRSSPSSVNNKKQQQQQQKSKQKKKSKWMQKSCKEPRQTCDVTDMSIEIMIPAEGLREGAQIEGLLDQNIGPAADAATLVAASGTPQEAALEPPALPLPNQRIRITVTKRIARHARPNTKVLVPLEEHTTLYMVSLRGGREQWVTRKKFATILRNRRSAASSRRSILSLSDENKRLRAALGKQEAQLMEAQQLIADLRQRLAQQVRCADGGPGPQQQQQQQPPPPPRRKARLALVLLDGATE